MEKEKIVSTSSESPKSSTEVKPIVDAISGKTTMYVLHLLYRANVLTRNNLREIFAEIKKPTPEDITKYLVGEVAKS